MQGQASGLGPASMPVPNRGLEAAAMALGGPDPWEARQAATARYTRTGFEAAAITAMAGRLAMMPRRGVLRTVELRFGHPYAGVAVTADDYLARGGGQAPRGPWDGVPVFSAWVAQPRHLQAQPPAQLHGGRVDGLARHLDPQVQSVAAGAATETVPHVPLQVRGEHTTARPRRTVHQTGSTQLRAPTRHRFKAEQVQYLV